jgi:hypothetical protein
VEWVKVMSRGKGSGEGSHDFTVKYTIHGLTKAAWVSRRAGVFFFNVSEVPGRKAQYSLQGEKKRLNNSAIKT